MGNGEHSTVRPVDIGMCSCSRFLSFMLAWRTFLLSFHVVHDKRLTEVRLIQCLMALVTRLFPRIRTESSTRSQLCQRQQHRLQQPRVRHKLRPLRQPRPQLPPGCRICLVLLLNAMIAFIIFPFSVCPLLRHLHQLGLVRASCCPCVRVCDLRGNLRFLVLSVVCFLLFITVLLRSIAFFEF
jgi:hypothetical protein